jgi:cellulose synthase/poly-beta-1,6-N-acetylglucosamine synthase-like glycosyltransferase
MTSKPIGEILIEKNLITKEQLAQALELQKETGSLLGEILISLGSITPIQLYQVITQQGPFEYTGENLHLLAQEIDPKLFLFFNSQDFFQYSFFPYRYDHEELEILTPNPNNVSLRHFLEDKFPGKKLIIKLITPYELDWLAHIFFKDKFLQEATSGLFYRSPEESAMRVFTPVQWISLGALCALILIGVFTLPRLTILILLGLANLFYAISVIFRFVLSSSGAKLDTNSSLFKKNEPQLRPNDLPTYSILLPLYHEPPNVIRQLTTAIQNLDYPPEKLDVIFLIEEDDQDTLIHCKAEKPPYNVRFVIVPEGMPKTKPRACNFGLAFARGEFLTIYDAEDIPERDQLKKAVACFRSSPPDIMCFQNALNFYNAEQNILTRLFTLEYSYWFDYLLPGLYLNHLPIPLGGTSNHFRTKILRDLGGWDPYNVTEDADLGMRASYRGYRVGILPSTTFEEANSRVKNWIRQRSRWLKGYLQTFLVHNRHPFQVVRNSGWKGWFTLQVFIGGTTLGQAFSLILWILFFIWLFNRGEFLQSYFSGPILYLGVFNLIVGNFLGIYLSMLAVFRRGIDRLIFYSLLNPLYWWLTSIAAWKGIFQLFTRPFFWEKTIHGLQIEEK